MKNSNKKEKYVKRDNNNKPRDYILEILPETHIKRSINKEINVKRTYSLPRKSNKQIKLNRRSNSLPDLSKFDIESNRRNNKLPPLPLQDKPPPIPIRSNRIKRLVEIKKRMKEQKEKLVNKSNLMTI